MECARPLPSPVALVDASIPAKPIHENPPPFRIGTEGRPPTEEAQSMMAIAVAALYAREKKNVPVSISSHNWHHLGSPKCDLEAYLTTRCSHRWLALDWRRAYVTWPAFGE